MSADINTNVLKVNDAGEQVITPSCSYVNLTAGTTLIKSTSGRLVGAVVNSHTSGTLKFFDHADAATAVASGQTITGVITLAAGERSIDFRGLRFGTGCVTQIGGTANVTLLYN